MIRNFSGFIDDSLRSLLMGPQISACLYAALDINLVRSLENGPKNITEICEEIPEIRPQKLERILKMLENNGIFMYNLETLK